MAQVLVISYSFTGQTGRIVEEVSRSLEKGGHTVSRAPLRLVHSYPFPAPPSMLLQLLQQSLRGQWPVEPLEPLDADLSLPYDLVIIGYQPWYMTPSVPVHSFLKSDAARVLRGKPVVGLVSCRAEFRRACGLFQKGVEAVGGQVVEQRVWVDQDARPTNLLSLVHMLKNGHDPEGGPLKRLLKPFGVGPAGLARAQSYGEALSTRLKLGPLSRDGQIVRMK